MGITRCFRRSGKGKCPFSVSKIPPARWRVTPKCQTRGRTRWCVPPPPRPKTDRPPPRQGLATPALVDGLSDALTQRRDEKHHQPHSESRTGRRRLDGDQRHHHQQDVDRHPDHGIHHAITVCWVRWQKEDVHRRVIKALPRTGQAVRNRFARLLTPAAARASRFMVLANRRASSGSATSS